VGEILLYTLSFALGIAVPALIVRWDLGRLSEERLARAWPDSSLWAAVVVFGPLCLPVHFTRTRRSLLGFGLGLLSLFVALLLVSLPIEALSRIFGIGE
jgi:hypothetical protein